jgi:hypothetical protein
MFLCVYVIIGLNKAMSNVMPIPPMFVMVFYHVFMLPKNECASNVHRVKLDSNWEVSNLFFPFLSLD